MAVVVSQLVGRVSIEGADQAQNNLKQVGTAATNLSEKLQTMKPWNAGNSVSDVDVAQAKLTLLESKVNDAREKLQTLQNAADAGQSVKGIPEAEANLVLLQEKAQQARAGLQELQSGGEQANAGLQQVDTGAQEANSGLSSLLSRLQETAGEMAGGFLSSVKETTSNLAGGFLGGVRDVASNLTGGFFGGIKNAVGGVIDFTSKIGFAYQGVQAMYQGFTSLGQAFLGGNASMEQTQVAFTQLLGSSKAATAELKDLQAFAAATPFQFPELANSTQKLLAFQYPLKETKPLLTAIGDALSGLGKNSAASLDQVVSVFGQMKSSSHLMTGDVMQLTSVGINGFQMLADQMGKPVTVVKDMISRGLIPANDGIEMLRKGMEKTFGGGMAAQATTFNGLLSTFQDNIGQAWRTFTGPLFDAAKKGLEQLGNLVSSPAFQNFATGAGQAVANTFSRIGQFVEYVHNVLRTVNLSDFHDAWVAVRSEVETVTARFGGLLEKVGAVKGDFDPLAETIHNLAQGGLDKLSGLLWDISGAFISVDRGAQQGKGPLQEIGGIFTSVKQTVQAVWPEVEKFVKALMEFSGPINLVQALARHSQDLGQWWQKSVVPALRDAEPHFASLGRSLADLVPRFERIAAVVHDNFQRSFDALLPVFEKAVPILIRVSGLIADGLGRAITFAAPYVEQITKAVSDFSREIAERVAPIISKWLDDFQRDLDAFFVVWNKIWPYLAPLVEGTWTEIVGIVKFAWSIVSGIVKIGLDILGGDWKRAWEDFKDMLSGAWDGIKTYLSGAWQIIRGMFNDAWMGIKAIFGPVGKWFQDRWHDIQNAFGSVGKWFQDQFTGAKNGTTSGFGDIGKWFADRWHDIQNVFGGIGKWFADRWNEITTPLRPITDYIGSIFQTIWNIISKIIQNVVNWLTSKWQEIVANVRVQWAIVQVQIEYYVTLIQQRINQIVSAIVRWLSDRWTEIKNTATSIWTSISGTISGIWNTIYNTVASKVNQVRDWIGARWNDVKNTTASIWGQITSTIGGWWDNIYKTATDKATSIKNGVLGTFGQIRDSVGGVFRTFVNNIIDQFNNAITAVNNFGSGFSNALNSLAKSLGANGVAQPLRIGLIPHYAQGTPSGGHPGGAMIVGEKGPELLVAPPGTAVLPHDKTIQLLTSSNSSIPRYANGIGDIASNIFQWIAGGAQSVLSNLLSSANIGAPNIGIGNWGSVIFDTVKNWALSWINGILPKFTMPTGGAGGSPVNIPGNVQSWIAAAMALTGVPSSWAGALATIAMHESGGNPSAINNWDINAKNGIPSQGLFQTVPPTFAAYMVPGHGNILNPIDNAAAAIRYIQSRYGTVFNVPGIVSMSHGGGYVGYAGGTDYNPRAGTYWVGEAGPEQIYLPRGAQVVPNNRLGQAPSTGTGQGATIILELNGRQFARAVLPDITDTIRYQVGAKF